MLPMMPIPDTRISLTGQPDKPGHSLEKRATIVSTATALLLVLVKGFVGLMSGSVAVLASAIDSALDLGVSAFNFFAISRSEKPADDRFNYGHGKIEALAATIEGSVIVLSGLFILYKAYEKAMGAQPTSHVGISIWVMVFSFFVTLALVRFLSKTAEETNNMVVKADALHYKTDLYSNGAVLVSLVIIKFSGFDMIDAIIGAAIAFYIIWSAIEIIQEGVLNLLDVALEPEMVEDIRRIIEDEPNVTSHHYLCTRRSGKVNFVDVHLVFDREISLRDAHRASDNIEQAVANLDPKHSWSINPHLDPFDDSHEEALRHAQQQA